MRGKTSDKAGFTLLELIAAAGFLAVLTASFYGSCRYLRKVEQAYAAEALALHVMENVVARCAAEPARGAAVVRDILEAELRQSPLGADPRIASACRADAAYADLTIEGGGARALARVRVPLAAGAAGGADAREGAP